MSANLLNDAAAITLVLQRAAKEGSGAITLSDVETLQHVIRTQVDLIETVHWVAQTVHQGYHADSPGTFETCGKNTCDAATQALAKARGG